LTWAARANHPGCCRSGQASLVSARRQRPRVYGVRWHLRHPSVELSELSLGRVDCRSMDSATPMGKPLIIIFSVLAASLLAPGIAAAEWSISCGPGEILAESSETGESECVAEEPQELEAEESEEHQAPEYQVIGPEAAASPTRRPTYAPVPDSPAAVAAPSRAAASRTTKPSSCRRASTAQLHADRLRVRRLHGRQRREAQRRLSLALC
jgi:hypothetical protein